MAHKVDGCYSGRTLGVCIMLCYLLLQSGTGHCWEAYDSTAYSKCYGKPKDLLYEGGIVSNPDFEEGLRGWSANGNCILQLRYYNTSTAPHGDLADVDEEVMQEWFVVAANRTAAYNGPAQLLPLLPNRTTSLKLSVSAWVQVTGSSSVLVKATLALDGGKQYVCAGTVLAKRGCWSFLKGGILLEPTITSARLYFETTSFVYGIELWLDRASVQPFTDVEWQSHQIAHKERLRRRSVSLRVVDPTTRKRVHNVDIQVVDTKLGFHFGSAILQNILNNKPYQKWFVERFNTAVFGNELKWYATERQQGRVDYNVTDAMVAFCEEHNLSVRGHNVVWDDPKFQQPWVKALVGRPAELRQAVMARVNSVVGRYAGRFIDWDVSNEQLHFSFYEDALSQSNFSTTLFLGVQDLDPSAQLFVNEYNTLEDCNDPASYPDAYIAKLRQLHAAGVANLGIGLEAHFTKPNIPYMRSTLDKLATLGFPIWLTELDINVQALNSNITQAAAYLEEVLREAYSHPAVKGIVMWTAFEAAGCYRMCLTDANMVNLPTGNVVDALLQEWQQVEVLAHSGGAAKWRGPVGIHNISIRWNNNSYYTSVSVSPGKSTQRFVALLPTNFAVPSILHVPYSHGRHSVGLSQ